MIKKLGLITILLLATSALAQSPTPVVVTDANGKALTVTGTPSATQVGSPTPVVITDANGKVIALGSGAGITFVAANPATCTPGTTGVVELNVPPYTVSYCSATNTWTALGAGGGAVSSVFTRTGAVVAAANDYNFNQIAGTVALATQASGNLPVANLNAGTGASVRPSTTGPIT